MLSLVPFFFAERRVNDLRFCWLATPVHVVVALIVTGTVPALAEVRQAGPTPTPIVFAGVTVVDVTHGKLFPDQRVVITGNHITAVGKTGAVKAPRAASVVDARGKYLIPGLWDMHVHPNYAAPLYYELFLANGVTGIRDASSDVSLDTLILWRQEILAGTRAGPPRQLLAGHVISTEDRALAQRQVDTLKAHGANFIKTYPFTEAGGAAAKQAGLRFGGHVPVDYTAAEVSDAGATIMDHLIDHSGSTGNLDSLCWAAPATVERCQPVAERFRHNGTWLVPTLSRDIVERNTSHIYPPRSRAIAAHLSEYGHKFWEDSGVVSSIITFAPVMPGPVNADTFSTFSADSLGLLHIMARVEFPILAGTDGDYPNTQASLIAGFALHAELAMYVAEGLTPLAALQTATLNPAAMLQGIDSLGTVAPGKLADLVLLDADPLRDITNTTAIRAVVANGRYYDRAALDQLVAEAHAATKTPPRKTFR